MHFRWVEYVYNQRAEGGGKASPQLTVEIVVSFC